MDNAPSHQDQTQRHQMLELVLYSLNAQELIQIKMLVIPDLMLAFSIQQQPMEQQLQAVHPTLVPQEH